MVILSVFLIYKEVNLSKYQKVTAVITEENTYHRYSVHFSSYTHIFTYAYEYQRKRYTTFLKEYLPTGKFVWQKAALYCDPSNPSKVDNNSQFYVCLLALGMVLAFFVLFT